VRSLVIGYGNDLRSDDGAGRVVADQIAAMDLPGVSVRSLMQLTPELALEMADVDTVIFIDASVEVTETTAAEVAPPPADPSALSHYATPEALLSLTRTMGNNTPLRAITISIPVTDIGLGMELTPATELGVSSAVSMVKELVTE
jgi:hydrogenase maturation protease